MHMIAGLGNPGREYEGSKHNAGFTVIDELARRWGVNAWQTRMDAEVAIANVDGEQVLLVKPQTYMNDSGKSVGPLMRWYKIDEKDVYVVYDDMDLPIGKLRIRENGSDGGHNGIKSLFANGCRDFVRFRLGIGRPLGHMDGIHQVLTPFPEEYRQTFADGAAYAAEAGEGCLKLGGSTGMNRYNPRRNR